MIYTIYKIICKDQNIKDLYIGSTKNFKKRKLTHKNDCNKVNGKSYNLLIYRTIRANGGFDNWYFEIVEELLDIEKFDALKKEEYYRTLLGASLNSYSASSGIDCNGMSRSEYDKEYKAQNREHYREYNKEYYVQNKDLLLEKNKEYRDQNIDHIKEQKKEYRAKNRELFSEKSKEYRAKNRELISEKKKEKIICSCGASVCRDSIARHKRTEKHNKNI